MLHISLLAELSQDTLSRLNSKPITHWLSAPKRPFYDLQWNHLLEKQLLNLRSSDSRGKNTENMLVILYIDIRHPACSAPFSPVMRPLTVRWKMTF